MLVVLGHFFQSMEQAGIISPSHLYLWFNQTIYYFHVPLFFICSGYLYQKYSDVNGIVSWRNHVYKKMLSLGIPYFTFSIATWILKTVFSGSTNSQIGGLPESLFLHPISPYWYLYALFFIFLNTPTVKNKKQTIGLLCVSVLAKILISLFKEQCLYAAWIVFSNEIWFVLGMCLCRIGGFKRNTRNKCYGIASGVLFSLLSIWIYQTRESNWWTAFLLGVIACLAVIVLSTNYTNPHKNKGVLVFLSKYTMPIFLMHTLFAAPFRIVLMKLGIQNAYVHIALGIAISIFGPIVAAEIMRKTKWLEIFLYPERVLKCKREKKL